MIQQMYVIRYYKYAAGETVPFLGSVQMTQAEAQQHLDNLRKQRPDWLAAAEMVVVQ